MVRGPDREGQIAAVRTAVEEVAPAFAKQGVALSVDVDPQSPEEMVERARQLANEIDAIDEQIKEEELAKLTGAPEPLPPEARANEEQADAGDPDHTDVSTGAAITPEIFNPSPR